MEEGVQIIAKTLSSQKPQFPTAEDWHGDQDVDEDIEKHRAKVWPIVTPRRESLPQRGLYVHRTQSEL